LFAYCKNNPVNMTDDSGHAPSPLGVALGIIGGIAGWSFGDYVADKLGCTGWQYWAVRAAVMVGGAAIGFFAGELVAGVVAGYLTENVGLLVSLPRWISALVGIGNNIYDNARLAVDVANRFGGSITAAQGDGWVVKIQNLTLRIMNSGGGRTNYWRLSVEGKGTVDIFGNFSSNRALTHIDIVANSFDDICNVINKLLGN